MERRAEVVAVEFRERERVEQRDVLRVELEAAARGVRRLGASIEAAERRRPDGPVVDVVQRVVAGALERVERSAVVADLEVMVRELERAVAVVQHQEPRSSRLSANRQRKRATARQGAPLRELRA